MRLIAWNANGVLFKKRTFEHNAELLWQQHADVVIIAETSGPQVPKGAGSDWNPSGNLGLGVAVRSDYSLSVRKKISHPVLSTACTVAVGPINLHLVAAWPVKAKGGPAYGEQLNAALADDVHGNFLRDDYAILVGDLNSTARIPAQAKLHHQFVDRAATLGLTSVYHEKKPAVHGREPEGDHTYRHGGPGKGHFHLDYCFLSAALLLTAEITILRGEEWEKLSDHFPIQIDFTVLSLPPLQ